MSVRSRATHAMISIHAPREGSDALDYARLVNEYLISIHAPREGSDHAAIEWYIKASISIHAPREGSDRDAI